METPPHVGKLVPRALKNVEDVLKLLALFVALITVLGTPAVTVQFVRFHVPLQFMTRDHALRAGIMPTIFLIALGLCMYWTLRNPTKFLEKLRPFEYGGVLSEGAGMSGVDLSNTSRWLTATTVIVLVFIPVAVVWNYVLHRMFNHLPRVIRGVTEWGLLQRTVWLAVFLLSVAVFYVSLRRMAFKFTVWVAKFRIVRLLVGVVGKVINSFHALANRVSHPLLQGAVFALILSVSLSAYDLSQKLIYGGRQWLRDGFWGGLLMGLAYGCLIAFLSVLAGALSQLSDPHTSKQGRATAYGAIFLIYFPVVALYASQWYPYIPYAVGGGKPTKVAVWLESKNLPESFKQIFGCAIDGELTLCEKTYLVHQDSDRTILADSNDAHASSFSVVLSKDGIKAISAVRLVPPASIPGGGNSPLGPSRMP